MDEKKDRPSSPLLPAESLIRRNAAPRAETAAQALLEDSRSGEAEHLPAPAGGYETPQILKAVTVAPTRRAFVAAALSATACSEMDILVKDGVCSCHAVCTCDTVGGDEEKDAEFNSTFDTAGLCSCDLVCTCNTVCTCESVGGGGGGGYSYTYYY